MEDKLGPAARLVDFLLGLHSRLQAKDALSKVEKYERAYQTGRVETDLQVTVSDRYSDRQEMNARSSMQRR